MKTEELTTFHLTALLTFHGKRSLTETSLARFLKAEKAVARHALNVLTSTGMIKKIGPYEWSITPEGHELLVEKQMVQSVKKAERKPRKISTVSEAVCKMADAEKEVLAGLVDGMAIVAEAVHELPPADPEPVHIPEPEPKQPTFEELVRRGLDRLNRQLGIQQVHIDRLDLKVETLASLAESVGQVDKNVQDILFAIASDLHLMADRSSK